MAISRRTLAFFALLASANSQSVSAPETTPPPNAVDSNDDSLRGALDLGTAVGGALDLPVPAPTAAPQLQIAAADIMRLTVINSFGADISTIRVDAAGITPIEGGNDPGVMHDGETASFAVPTGWTGNIAFNDAAFSDTTGDESLVEGSFNDQGQGMAQSDINISYVNGFSVPLVCWCNDDMGLFSGCNKDLRTLNECEDDNGQNSCRNPTRPGGVTAPIPFFAPCHGPGGPYTFPDDSAANNLNQVCGNNEFTCCVGTACPPNPAQDSFA